MPLVSDIQKAVTESLSTLYQKEFSQKDFQVSETKPEFEGDYTVVLFSLVKKLQRSPELTGTDLGSCLINNYPALFTKYTIVKGFLNLSINEEYWTDLLEKKHDDTCFGKKRLNGKCVMVEYSSPNTNKPLHLGHLRNNFLGWSVGEILKAVGYEVVKTCVVNDRGIHICKSMIAWEKFAAGATPSSTGRKGDHFVGDYYVRFNDEYVKEVNELVAKGKDKKEAEKEAPLMVEAQKMLNDWEAGKPEVINLWKMMNGWVYDGFEATYKRIGSNFDHTYYESNTYLSGKEFVMDGLAKGILYKKDDGSVWIDLADENLDEKLLLRKDGTSVYITQDIGLAKEKFEVYRPEKSIYVIGDEQNHHMKVLKAICKKLGFPFADDIYHLNYGMVELTTGKMKSREGTVVDADDLMDEMVATAKYHTEQLGKVKDFTESELKDLFEVLAIGAMKFYLLRVDPKKRMVFNPEESIDFHGFTGPFIQYTYARIQSILRKIAGLTPQTVVSEYEDTNTTPLLALEKAVIIMLEQYETVIEQAAEELNPSVIANYIFHLAKAFNSFYTDHSIANAETPAKKSLRIRMAKMTANVIESGMKLMGIRVPVRM